MFQYDEKKDKLASEIQRGLNGNPAILVGSGGSVPYGLPSMWSLSQSIILELDGKYNDNPLWAEFKSILSETGNLESALENISLQSNIQNDIIYTVWKVIENADKVAYQKFIADGDFPVIAKIIGKFLRRAGETNIITTNYDRLIEYAVDYAEGYAETGFGGMHHRVFKNVSTQTYNRAVNIFKVHGSIDWFRHIQNHNIIATSLMDPKLIGNTYHPQIVTPGNAKFRETHNDPFRSVIAEADKVLRKSYAYLCIGYGFNDEHIQPIIIDENRNREKFVAIITKDITPKIRELFLDRPQANSIVISHNPDGGTCVNRGTSEPEYHPENYWNLSEFNTLWLGQ